MDTTITLVAGWPHRDRTIYNLIYWYPIEDAIAGAVPTPAVTLPEWIVREAKLPAGYVEALDAGKVAFELVRLEGQGGEPEAAYVARFWDDYHRRYAAFRNAYENRRRANRLAAPRPTPTPDRTCEVCDSSLNGFRADARTCSSACRQQAYRWRKDAA